MVGVRKDLGQNYLPDGTVKHLIDKVSYNIFFISSMAIALVAWKTYREYICKLPPCYVLNGTVCDQFILLAFGRQRW